MMAGPTCSICGLRIAPDADKGRMPEPNPNAVDGWTHLATEAGKNAEKDHAAGYERSR